MAATVSVLERVRTKPSRLARQPLLRQLSPRQLRRMASVTEEVVVPAGELLVEQGRHGFWFFLVERGHADVVRDGRVVGSLGRGDHIGTTAVLWRVPEPVTVRARSEMTLFAVGNQWFVPLVRDLPALRRALGVPPAPPAVRAHRRRRPRAAVHEVAWLTGPVGPPRLSRLARWRVAGAVVVGLAAAALYHPPVAVIAPGPTFDAARDIEVTGVPVTPVHGRYLVTTVQAQRPTVLGVVSAVARAHDRVVGLDRLDPPGLGRQEASRRRHEAFRASQDAAVAAATHLAGITAGSGIEVRFRPRSVGGPSAGLAYALALTDLLDGRDLAAGRTVVVTGALEPGGAVRPVGFVGEKALAGRRARASLLLVPEDQVGDALAAGVQVRGVTSLGEAVGDLRTP